MTLIEDTCDEGRWKRFLDGCDEATIYHTPEWKKFLEDTFGYRSYFLFVKDDRDELIGMLPLYNIKSVFTSNYLSCSPFSHICGYIGDMSARSLVYERLHALYKDLGVKFIEIRNKVDMQGFEEENWFSDYYVDLSPGLDRLWTRISHGKKKTIRKQKKNGMKIKQSCSIDDLKKFYELNCMTKRDIGVPCHPWKLFYNQYKNLGDHLTLYNAEYQGEIVSGIVLLLYKKTAISAYSATRPDVWKLSPSVCVTWSIIEDLCSQGYTHYDLGRASSDNLGLIEYKKQWGSTCVPISYNYYPKRQNLITNNRNNLKYRLGTKVFQNMPLPVYKFVSDRIFGQFG